MLNKRVVPPARRICALNHVHSAILIATFAILALTLGDVSPAAVPVPVPGCPSDGRYLVNVDPPVVTGSAAVGGTLTTTGGTWTDNTGTPVTPSFRYEWYRDRINALSTGASYTVVAADVGHELDAHVIAFTGAGTCGPVGTADNYIPIDFADSQGTPSADQTEPTSDTTDFGAPSSPTPMTPTGPAPSGSYTIDSWSAEETDSPTGLQVVTSTAPGTFALTGLAIDQTTGDAVQGATVTLSRTGGTLGSVTTGADGGFAFSNMPPPTAPATVTLSVASPTLGSYTLTNVSSSADQTYQVTAFLDGTAQTWNDATSDNGVRAAFNESASTATNWRYPSNKYIPPSIRVAQYKLDSGCGPQRDAQGNAFYLGTRRFRWRYYVLHVLAGEISGNGWPNGYFGQEATKTNAAAIQSYAWYRRLRSQLAPPFSGTAGANTAYDITNTTFSQCFVTGTVNTGVVSPPRSAWSKWLPDVLATRITDGTTPGTILNTEYRGANPTHPCTSTVCDFYFNVACRPNQSPPFIDPYFGAFATTASPDPVSQNKFRMSQLGAKAAEDRCGLNVETTGFVSDSWTSIVNYYYKLLGSVTPGYVPPRPNTHTFTTNPQAHTITFSFSSKLGTSPVQVAWRYNLVRYGDGSFVSVCCSPKAPRSVDDPVQTSFTYLPPIGTCFKYKVRASNPNGFSQFVDFNSGNVICRP